MSLLDHYWTLANEDPAQRVDAAEALIRGLVESNDQKDWDYALNRLITGLSSSRGSARLGFSMALAEVLNTRQTEITVHEYLERVAKAFQITGGMKGGEERGLLFGKLFSLQTLATSPLWQHATQQDFDEFVDTILDLSLKKVWLREPAGFALCELVSNLDSIPIDKDQALTALFAKVHERGLSLTCEGVALALTVSPADRLAFNSNNGWKEGNPLAKGNLAELSRVLKDLPVGNKENQRNNWKPTIHFVWNKILIEILEGAQDPDEDEPPRKKQKKDKKSKKDKKAKKDDADTTIKLPEFWRSAVDEGFFSHNASPERKMWGFEIFVGWVPNVEDVLPLISTNLVRTLANQLAQNDRFLHKMAKRVVATVIEVSKQNPAKASEFVQGILKISPNFDSVSKSKTVQDLIGLTNGNVGELATLFLSIFATDKELNRQRWALDNIMHLLKSCKQEDNIDWVQLVFDALVPIAYFTSDSSEKVIELAQERITSLLSATMSRPVAPMGSWPYYVLKRIIALQEAGQETLVSFEGDILKARQRAEATVERVHKKRISSRHVDSPQLQAFELLFSMVLLQLYASNTEAVTILDELLMVYSKIAGKDQLEDDDDLVGDASQVLTEILISFLSQQSALLRKLSEEVWASFSEQISSESLKLLYDILDAKEGLQGQQELFDLEDDADDDEDDEDEEDEEEDEDEEMADDSSEVDKDTDVEAEKALAATLGVRSGYVEISSEEDDDDEDEDSMDDDQMAALDGQLATIFRERQARLNKDKEQRKEGSRAKQNITLLKSRVLDLLDIYITRQPSNLRGLGMAVAVLELIRTTKDKALADRARDFIRNKFCRKTTYTLENETDVEQTTLLLQAVQDEASASTSKPHSMACNQVGVFAAKLLVAFDTQLVEVVSSIYSKSLVNWFCNNKNQTTPNLFIDMVNFLASKR